MLQVDRLTAGYGAVEVLHDVSIKVAHKQIVTVIGANGAGKSTLINTISRLIAVCGGAVTFDGHDLSRVPAASVVDLGIIQVPEGRQLFGPLTVRENLTLGFQRQRRLKPGSFKERLEFVHELFPRLAERADQRAVTLSGGEQQMVAIGRALMADPQLLLLDEPSLGLAPLVIDRIFEVLQELQKSGLTMLLVEQRAEAALELADYAYVLSVGRVVAEGPAEKLRQDEAIKKAYLAQTSAMA
ncbi:MAG: ABC transporter ATP-binding protein [Pseudorhodoplanes sp.]|nr:ABC transporter ATP-binding protein [Pseudorhodoplanes sp.]